MEILSIQEGTSKFFIAKNEKGDIFPVCDTNGRICSTEKRIRNIKNFNSYKKFSEHVIESFNNCINSEILKKTGIKTMSISGDERAIQRRKIEREPFLLPGNLEPLTEDLWKSEIFKYIDRDTFLNLILTNSSVFNSFKDLFLQMSYVSLHNFVVSKDSALLDGFMINQVYIHRHEVKNLTYNVHYKLILSFDFPNLQKLYVANIEETEGNDGFSRNLNIQENEKFLLEKVTLVSKASVESNPKLYLKSKTYVLDILYNLDAYIESPDVVEALYIESKNLKDGLVSDLGNIKRLLIRDSSVYSENRFTMKEKVPIFDTKNLEYLAIGNSLFFKKDLEYRQYLRSIVTSYRFRIQPKLRVLEVYSFMMYPNAYDLSEEEGAGITVLPYGLEVLHIDYFFPMAKKGRDYRILFPKSLKAVIINNVISNMVTVSSTFIDQFVEILKANLKNMEYLKIKGKEYDLPKNMELKDVEELSEKYSMRKKLFEFDSSEF